MPLLKGLVLRITLLSFLVTGLTLPLHADVLTTQDYLSAAARAEHLSVIDSTLMRQDVQRQLIAMGVDPEHALERIAQLPDEDIAQLAVQMEELPAGGSLLAVIGVVFVVLLILELTGVTNIFTNI